MDLDSSCISLLPQKDKALLTKLAMRATMKINAAQSLFTVMLVVSSVNVWSTAMVYKCKNQEGALVYQKSPCKNDADTVDSWAPKETANPQLSESGGEQDKDGKAEPSPVLTLKQNAGGHYATNGDIDGKSLNFVIDTGASYVALPEALAHSALIYCDEKKVMNTANGKTDACTAKIKKLQFGPFLIHDVAAVIVPNLDQPLLGMNVLGLFKIAQDKGEMQISVLGKEKTEKD
jgi:clan AA aspartic protease (TIGR02281 family)